MNKNAFSLSEIIITLGVIGVVAAITLPTVIHNIQMAILHAQFKKTYSIISNAFEKAKVDSEYSLTCYGDDVTGCIEFNDIFQAQFKVMNTCNNNAYSKGCIGDIKGTNNVIADKNSSTNQTTYSSYYDDKIKNVLPAFITNQGFSVVFYNKNYRLVYLIDVNGPKKPNKWGYDVYSLDANLNGNTKLGCTYALKNFFEEGGKGCEDMMMNK